MRHVTSLALDPSSSSHRLFSPCRSLATFLAVTAARAELVIPRRAGGKFQPMPDRHRRFLRRGRSRAAVSSGIIAKQPAALGLFRAARQVALSRAARPSTRRRASMPGRCAGAQALVTGRVTRDPVGPASSAEFRLWDVDAGPAARRPAILHRSEFLAPRRPHHLRRGLYQDHGLRRLLRHPHGVRRRIGAEGEPPQAARHHGPGRRQCALPDARRQPRRDAALFAGDAGHHLHVAGRGAAAARSGDQPRDRLAPGRRQLPRHDLLAALRARRASASS